MLRKFGLGIAVAVLAAVMLWAGAGVGGGGTVSAEEPPQGHTVEQQSTHPTDLFSALQGDLDFGFRLWHVGNYWSSYKAPSYVGVTDAGALHVRYEFGAYKSPKLMRIFLNGEQFLDIVPIQRHGYKYNYTVDVISGWFGSLVVQRAEHRLSWCGYAYMRLNPSSEGYCYTGSGASLELFVPARHFRYVDYGNLEGLEPGLYDMDCPGYPGPQCIVR